MWINTHGYGFGHGIHSSEDAAAAPYRDLAWETMNIFSPVETHDALDVDATFGVGLATTDTAL